MALGQIAPWLQLPNFQAAAEAGARIGLQQRTAAEDAALGRAKLAQEAVEASGRLSLGLTEAGTAARRAAAEQDMAKAALALHQGRYSDLNKQAADRLELGRDRFNGLEDNRDTVNGLHQDTLDHRVEVDALRGTRLPGVGSRAGTVGPDGLPVEKPHMVNVVVPGINGGKDRHVSRPSTDPRAKEYLDRLFEIPIDEPGSLYSGGGQGGETLPLPGSIPPDGVPALRPRNSIYTGDMAGGPPQNQNPSNLYTGPASAPAITEPGPMPPEELQGPAALPAATPISKEVASGFLKQAKGDKDAARKLARAAGYTF